MRILKIAFNGFWLTGVILSILIFSGCGENKQDKKARGKRVENRTPLPATDSFRVTPNGLHYIIHRNKKGPTPKKGDIVRMEMLIQTGEMDLMNTFVGEKDYYMEVKEPEFKGDILEILPRLSRGDSVTTKTVAAYLYKGRVPPQIGRYDTVYTHFTILGFFNEKEALMERIKNEGHEVDTLDDGLYRTFFNMGSGPAIRNGDSVVMQFTGYLLDGTVFNSTKNKDTPLAFTYGKRNLLKGLKLGIKDLREGAHVKLYMTSKYGYGHGGARPLITPYSPLIYEIRVRKVIRQKKLSLQ